MSYLTTPEPDEPNPPGVTPNKPKDRSVYGGRWGDSGGPNPTNPLPDRPKPIETPKGDDGLRTPEAPPPSNTP